MTLEEQEHRRPAAISKDPRQSEVRELREQVAMLTEQVPLLLLLIVDVDMFQLRRDMLRQDIT